MNKQQIGFCSFIEGHKAEDFAREILQKQGYTFIAQNVQIHRGYGASEIDLIMQDKEVLVFIEVKKRKTLQNCMESLTPSKQLRFYRGAEIFISQNPQYQNMPCRFDLFCVNANKEYTHLENILYQ